MEAGCKIEDDVLGVSLRLDMAGRWSTFRLGSEFYRRCMDGRVVRGATGEPLTDDQAEQVYLQAFEWLQSLDSHEPIVQRGRRHTLDYYRQVKQIYLDVYPEPVSILPPDRYGDLVIQPARGCPNRRCTFCAFYKDKPYSVLNQEQLQRHVDGVKTLFGDAMYQRQGVFLGSANAMALSQRRLMNCLHLIGEQTGILKRGVATFSDPDFSAPRTQEDWKQLNKAGLSQIVIGLETGWSKLRASLGKSGCLDKVTAAIVAAKSASIKVSLTLLTGTVERTEVALNIKSTLEYLKTLPLTRQDIIYLSPLSYHGLSDARAMEEVNEWTLQLRCCIPAKVVGYQLQRFNYYA